MKLLQIETTLPDANQLLDSSQLYVLKIKDMALDYAPKILGAILVYLIGSWIISRIACVSRKMMVHRKFDVSLQTFLISLIKVGLTVMMFLAIVGMLGVNITSFAALLAGAGLAVGAALNGSLGNLAGGVMLMIFKPFSVGEMIEAQGSLGEVLEIGIFNTKILTPDNKVLILPNGALSTGSITNYTAHGNLRVDLTIAVDLTVSIEEARRIATQAMLSHPKVLEQPG